MRQATKSNVRSTLIVSVALLASSILIETAGAVEVSGEIRSESATPELSADLQPHGHLGGKKPSRDCFILASRSFTIPFTVDQTGARPVEVRLYVSHGPADTWEMLANKSPSVALPQFEFTADADGEYWFATRTIDAAGNPHPGDDIKPQLKVYVDTTQPRVELSADASADGKVDALLTVDDATPIKDIVLRYVTDKAKEWSVVNAAELSESGKQRFVPASAWERLSLQLIATDQAGNQTVVNRLVQRPRIADRPAKRYGHLAPENVSPSAGSVSTVEVAPYRIGGSSNIRSQTISNPFVRQDQNAQVQFQSDPRTRGPAAPSYVTGRPKTPFDGYRGSSPQPSTPFFKPTANQLSRPSQLPKPAHVPATDDQPQFDLPAPVGGGIGLEGPKKSTQGSTHPSGTTNAESVPVPRDNTVRPKRQTKEPNRRQPQTVQEAIRPLSERSAVPKPERVPTPKPKRHFAERPAPPEPPRAPVRHSDSERFSLEYELQAVGNLGVDAIELYGSTDGGNTWDLWGTDPDKTSPFDIETKEEGVFSFRIVVVGRNGLASPRPQTGETPDIVVVVDKARPKTRITAAQYGEGNRIGALVIRYECIDPNLGSRPITLSFSDSTSGPWTTIAAGLRNDGDYVWPADPKLPRQIYLRLDCKDEAGNVGTYVLEKPIDVQGLAPRARIRGFQSLSGMEAFPVDQQTAERPTASLK